MKDRIFQFMKQQGMSQKQFANELCVAEATLSSIFTGRTRPSNALVAAIHERFPEVSISWLMFGEGDMYAGETVKESPLPSTPSPSQGDLFAPSSSQPSIPEAAPVPSNGASPQPILRETIKFIDKPQRKITEIRVFFDDGTYETFSAN
ncbi:MAG: helix-turn-helix domain-containing protein [Bacteroidaceae bacterium]|nr:helix-turn-helix domain-containing protein [Bacteroidaceae bacterium]